MKSKRTLMVSLIIIKVITVIILIFITGSIISHFKVSTPAFKNANGMTQENSIAEFIRIKLGGHSHGILIRGRDLNNPMILFLHAGPGLSETGMFRNMCSKLEDYYTIVYFDQRGASKSYSPFMSSKTFNKKQLVQDLHELTRYLKKRFRKDKIVILGHSFGAGFGSFVAVKYPEDYSAFIGIGQPTNISEIDRLSYDWVSGQARKTRNIKATAELEKVNNYWLKKDRNGYFKGMMVNKKWVGFYGGQIYGLKGFMPYVLKNSLCREFNIFDYPAFLLGMSSNGPASWEIMTTTNLIKEALDYKCPFILLSGRNDYNAVPSLINDYYNLVKAPLKRQYWFENSAHFPHFEESEKFIKIMIEDVLPIINDQEKS